MFLAVRISKYELLISGLRLIQFKRVRPNYYVKILNKNLELMNVIAFLQIPSRVIRKFGWTIRWTTMAKHRILLFALFAISALPKSLAFCALSSPDSTPLQRLFNPLSDDEIIRIQCRCAARIFARDPTIVASMLPLLPRGSSINKNYDWIKSTMHLNNTGSYDNLSSTEKWPNVQWSGMSQICPQSNNRPTNYNCENVVLLVNEAQWEKSDKGYIYYNLMDIREVDLIGHDRYENIFDHIFLVSWSVIKGGRSSNTYKIKYVDGATKIYLNSASKQEVIDVSYADYSPQVNIKLYAINNSIRGELQPNLDYKPATLECTDILESDIGNRIHEWRIIGRKDKPDIIECTNYKMMDLLRTKIQVHAQGSGGSFSFHDIITNCMYNMLNPSTTYKFTYPNEEYHIKAEFEDTALSGASRVYSTIELQENAVVLDFNSQNYFGRILSMKYSPWDNTLTLEIVSDQNVIVLDVKSVLRNQTINQFFGMNISNNSQLREWPALSIKKQSSADILYPIVERSFGGDIDVTKFRLSKQIFGTSLNDAIDAYHMELAQRTDKWGIEVMIKLKSTEEMFWFGTPAADNSLIFGAMKYIKGQNGTDFLELTDMMHEYVWIDNEAADGLVDTLQIDSRVCKDLQVRKHTANQQFVQISEFDLVVICEKNDSGPSGKLVLMNYLKDKLYRHLKIFRDNVEYVILPKKWISSAQSDSNAFSLVRIIDLKSSDTIHRRVIEPGNFWILWDKSKTSEIEARKENSNVVLSVKSTNSTIELNNFRNDGEVSEEWRDKFFAIADDLSDDSPRVIQATEIDNLLGQQGKK